MMPLFVDGALGDGGYIAIVPGRKYAWADAVGVASKVHRCLKEVLEGKEMDVTASAEGAFPPAGPPPPDPKAKAPPSAVSAIDDSLALLEAAMEAAEVTTADVQIAIAPSGPLFCEVTEEELPLPEGAEEGTEPEKVDVYTYSFGEPKRSEECVEYLVGLVDKGVNMLIDPMHSADPGLKKLAAALTEKSANFVLGGNTYYNNDAAAVQSAAEAAVDPDDGETRPWARCIQVNTYTTGSISSAAAVSQAMFDAKGRVILQNSTPHVAIGLGVDYVRFGTVSGERIAEYNDYCRIEQSLKESGKLAQ